MVATNELTHAQAQLFIGAHEQILHHITKKLTAHFCAENGCGNCVPCRQVLEQRHHSILWLTTERLYTLDQIDPVTERLIMQLQDDEQFFFVIQHADKLSSASANKLLKPIEEPPAGYHFLLLAEHKEQVIPTIRSRCHIIESSSTTAAQPNSRLVSYFTALKEPSAVDFLKDLDKEKPNDQESLAILRTLYQYWS